MIVFPCGQCGSELSAEDSQQGQRVRCPSCRTVLRVPSPGGGVGANVGGSSSAKSGRAGGSGGASSSATATAPPPPKSPAPLKSGISDAYRQNLSRGSGNKRYGFNCGYCSSRLEATEQMAAQEGQCPTCGNNIVIPILDRYGRLIDPTTGRIIKQDPHPVHAYAAAGDRAPTIFREQGVEGAGPQRIRCPRCSAASPITANNCKSCGMPFTMEGTTLEAAGTSNGFCVASLVLGIIGIPAYCTLVTPALAIVFGVIGFNQVSRAGHDGGGKGMAIAGMVLGAIGSMIAASMFW